jgi:hypothetical protein
VAGLGVQAAACVWACLAACVPCHTQGRVPVAPSACPCAACTPVSDTAPTIIMVNIQPWLNVPIKQPKTSTYDNCGCGHVSVTCLLAMEGWRFSHGGCSRPRPCQAFSLPVRSVCSRYQRAIILPIPGTHVLARILACLLKYDRAR